MQRSMGIDQSEPEALSERVSMTLREGCLRLLLRGEWSIHGHLEDVAAHLARVRKAGGVRTLVVNGEGLSDWDSALIAYLYRITRFARQQQIRCEFERFPDGVIRVLDLATSGRQVHPAESVRRAPDWLEQAGFRTVRALREFLRFTDFLGESLISLRRFVLGRAVFRRQDLITFLQDAGPSSLGIVTLISILIGMILAFVGSVQLERFGASIYVANLVGLSMAREMAAMMTAIIMAGRTGASYAAQLGSMQVNEEIDALKTMGVSPMEFLVLPRLIALVLMMPLLTIYANLLGIFGGGLVSVWMLDVSWSSYLQQISHSVPLIHFAVGLFKSVLFGILVALAGCYMGMHSGRSATAVGAATTSAVVLGIVLIIVCDSLVTIITTVLKI